MEHWEEQLNRVAKDVYLAAKKKQAMRAYLSQYTKKYGNAAAKPGGISAWFLNPMPVFAVVSIVVLLGGGTSFAAQGALPGDTLYFVKVGVNEKIAAALKFAPETKAEYQAELAARRLGEAEALDDRGSVPEEVQDQLEARFLEHSAAARIDIVKVKERGNARAAAAIASKFEDSLRRYPRFIEQSDQETSAVISASRGTVELTVTTSVESEGGPAGTGTVDVGAGREFQGDDEVRGQEDRKEEKSSKRKLKSKVRSVLDELGSLRQDLESEIEREEELRENSESDHSERDSVPQRDDDKGE